MVDEFDPEALVRVAVAGPAAGDRGRHRSVVFHAARPQLRRERVRRRADPTQDRVVVDRVGGATGQIHLTVGRVEKHGVVVGAEEAQSPIRGERAVAAACWIGSIEEPANSIVRFWLVIAVVKCCAIPAGDTRDDRCRGQGGIAAAERGQTTRSALGRSLQPILQVGQAGRTLALPGGPNVRESGLVGRIHPKESEKTGQVSAGDGGRAAWIGRPNEEGLAVVTRPLRVAVEGAGRGRDWEVREGMVRLPPNLWDTACPRGVGQTRGIGRVAVQFPESVEAGEPLSTSLTVWA